MTRDCYSRSISLTNMKYSRVWSALRSLECDRRDAHLAHPLSRWCHHDGHDGLCALDADELGVAHLFFAVGVPYDRVGPALACDLERRLATRVKEAHLSPHLLVDAIRGLADLDEIRGGGQPRVRELVKVRRALEWAGNLEVGDVGDGPIRMERAGECQLGVAGVDHLELSAERLRTQSDRVERLEGEVPHGARVLVVGELEDDARCIAIRL
mmetsp:Transcript_40527/g.86495  ORF Transcript_40527/g.86495 Transcript_40527/m.86495 type:complete len:212 (-) Transcript_40527:409-1044(-)